jgi:hypothetical protein
LEEGREGEWEEEEGVCCFGRWRVARLGWLAGWWTGVVEEREL